MMIVLNIEAFQPLTDFEARMERMIEELKAVPLAQGHQEIFYPGEIEARNDARNRRDGLMLPPDTIRDLEKVAAECGLAPPTAP
jgi:LDH2 family malate/lactate/ureidoglycolate dehydrogenase